jgi:hypothetical protein
MMKSPTLLISYSHDSEEHRNRVAQLANQLRQDGINCWIDQFEPHPSQGWPMWMEQQVAQADFVFLVCTDRYLKRFNGTEDPGVGRGVMWESILIRNELYEGGHHNSKFIPIGFEPGFEKFIPARLRGDSHYRLDRFSFDDSNYTSLYRYLTGQTGVHADDLGPTVQLPTLQPKNCIADVAGVRAASRLLLASLASDKQGQPPRYEAAYALRYLGFDIGRRTIAKFILDNEFWMFREQETPPNVVQFVMDDFRVVRHAPHGKQRVRFVLWIAADSAPDRDLKYDADQAVICVNGLQEFTDFLEQPEFFGRGSPLSKLASLDSVLFDESWGPSDRIDTNVSKVIKKRFPGQTITSTAIFWDTPVVPPHLGNALKGVGSLKEMMQAARKP